MQRYISLLRYADICSFDGLLALSLPLTSHAVMFHLISGLEMAALYRHLLCGHLKLSDDKLETKLLPHHFYSYKRFFFLCQVHYFNYFHSFVKVRLKVFFSLCLAFLPMPIRATSLLLLYLCWIMTMLLIRNILKAKENHHVGVL